VISVLIPVYNGEKTIGKCIESLQKQTKKPDEIIVVDDGSTDKTKDIVEKHKGVKLLKQDHKGPAAARNLGARKAKGDVLLFTDADCVADKKWVSEMTKPFRNKEIIGVQGRYKTFQNGVIPKFVQLEIEDRYDRMKKREHIDFIGSYSAAYRKDAFLEAGGFNESFSMASGEDPELSFKLSRSGHKMLFRDSAIVYHEHVNSLGAYLKQKFWRAYWRVLLYRRHPSKIKGESYTPQTLKFKILFLYLFGSALLASPFIAYMTYVSLLFLLLLIITTLPLSCKIFRQEKGIGLIAPVILILRTFVFSMGLIYGVIKL